MAMVVLVIVTVVVSIIAIKNMNGNDRNSSNNHKVEAIVGKLLDWHQHLGFSGLSV